MAKQFWKSKTFWAAAVVIVGAIGHMVQTGTVTMEDITVILGAIGSIYGRTVATGPLTVFSDDQSRTHL